MTLLDTVELTFITPCFCSGSAPDKPEIRVASLRSEFRRWLRIMGADLATESRIMGSAAGDAGNKSLLTFRVSNIVPAQPQTYAEWRKWKPPQRKAPGNNGYLSFFLRKQNKECLAPGTRFTLEAWLRKPLSEEDDDLFWQAWDAMIDYGSIGARNSRGFGAWVSKENAEKDELPGALENEMYNIEFYSANPFVPDIFNGIGKKVKNLRRENGYSGKDPSPMGYVNEDSRQKSVYIFRPVKYKGGMKLLVLYFPDFYAEPQKSFNDRSRKTGNPRDFARKRSFSVK